jgi:hypothetical protein
MVDTLQKKTILRKFVWKDPWATVAQLVEHLTRNEDVCGSTPHGGSNHFKDLCDRPVLVELEI